MLVKLGVFLIMVGLAKLAYITVKKARDKRDGQ